MSTAITDEQLAFLSGYPICVIIAMTPDMREILVRRYT